MSSSSSRIRSSSPASTAARSTGSDDSSSCVRRRRVGGMARRLQSGGATIRGGLPIVARGQSSASSLMDLLQNVRLSDDVQQKQQRNALDDTTHTTSSLTSLSRAGSNSSSRGSASGEFSSLHSASIQSQWPVATSRSTSRPIGALGQRRPVCSSTKSCPQAKSSKFKKDFGGFLNRIPGYCERTSRLNDSPMATSNDAEPTGGRKLIRAVSSSAHVDCIKSIIREHPKAVGEQSAGGGPTPLHCAINNYNFEVSTLNYMLNACPEAAAIRCDGRNSVDLLYSRFVEPADYRQTDCKTKAAVLRAQIEEAVSSENGENSVLSGAVTSFWNIILPFISAAAATTTSAATPQLKTLTSKRPATRRAVHDCITINAPPLLIQLAALQQPGDILAYMDRQRLPLCIAAIQGLTCLGTVADLFPSAASQVDSTGRLPLHHAIAVATITWEGGIENVVRAFPRGLTIKDPETGLPPVLQAAVSSQTDLSIIFSLLTACPQETMSYALSHRE